jgi:hypothetical protein
MLYFFSWGKTFLARFDEFWPSQIARILRRANRLFQRRPHDDDLECAAQIRASIIPFVMYDYGLALVLNDDLWTLEIAEFPPHAEPGERIRKARRLREQKEKKEQRARERATERAAKQAQREAAKEAKRAAKAAKDASAKKNKKEKKKAAAERIIVGLKLALPSMLSVLYKIAGAPYDKFKQDGRKLASIMAQVAAVTQERPLTVRQQLLAWIVPSLEDCKAARIAGWKQDPLPRDAQRERRLFFADFLPMWLDTIAPIESMFVRDGQSLFGELFLESECVS